MHDLRSLDPLADVLERQAALATELATALAQQRAAVAAQDDAALELASRAVQDLLLALEDIRRQRADCLATLAGDPDLALAALESRFGAPLPDRLVTARARLSRAAADAAREAAITRGVLKRAMEAGDAFLQELFSAVAGPTPGYGAPRPRDGAGVILDRSA